MAEEAKKSVPKIDTPGFPAGFHELLGQFHCIWLMFDVTLDYSIGHFLGIDREETHILVSGLEFGRKLRLLVELLKRSDHPKKDLLVECIGKLQAAKRDYITHSYIASNTTNVSFIYRSRGEFKSGRLEFHIDEFAAHVAGVVLATQLYQRNLGASGEEIDAFAIAVLNMSKS